jgi:Holliday junction DNA helicase RuvA
VIAHLTGQVLSAQDGRMVVDVHGVGYEVLCPAPTCLAHKPGEEVSLFVRTLVRDDTFQLFGFGSAAEKDLFVLITGVSGLGPKLALALLSEMDLADLALAIRQENVARLTRVSGIGKKTAERVCLELKDKVLTFTVPEPGALPGVPRAVAAGASEAGPLEDAVSALMNLGYPRGRAEAAVRTAAAESSDPSLEELVRKGLGALARST